MRTILQFVMAWAIIMVLAACAVSPKPAATPSNSSNPPVTPIGGSSPLPTATRGASPLHVPTLGPLDAPTTAVSPTATSTPVPSLTPLLPSSTAILPSATPLIVVSTPTRLAPVSTSARVIPAPTGVIPPTTVPTRAPTRTPAPTVPPVLVTAWVSQTDPRPGVDVQVYGRLLVNGQPVKGEGMVARWHLKGGSFVDCVGDTGADGVASCTENTYGLPARFTVRIEVFIKYNRPPYQATTELTIDD